MQKKKRNMKIDIEFLPEGIEKDPILKLCSKVINDELEPHETIPYGIIINFVDPNTIRELNLTYRKSDQITDILTYIYDEEVKCNEQHYFLLGEIFINMDAVISQAVEYQMTTIEELYFLIAHGCLHLCGYTHETEVKLKSMLQLQRTYMEQIL